MSDGEGVSDTEVKPTEDKEKKPVITLQQAPSNRSTCKTSQESIEKGEWRIGMEAWAGGRVSMQWQKLKSFWEHCQLELCETKRKNQGTCKVSGHKFSQGDARFICMVNSKSRLFMTIAAAGETLAPVVEQSGQDFLPLATKGLEDMPSDVREAYAAAFKVPEPEMAAFNKDHPAPAPPSEDAPSPKKRKKVTTPAKPEPEPKPEEPTKAEEKPEAAAEKSKPEPASKKAVGKKAAAKKPAAEKPAGGKAAGKGSKAAAEEPEEVLAEPKRKRAPRAAAKKAAAD